MKPRYFAGIRVKGKLERSLLICLAAGYLFIPAWGQTSIDTEQISIKGIPGMQYDPVRFSVKPGSMVTIVFSNVDEMDHNLVIAKKGSRDRIVAAASALGQAGPVRGYIPDMPEILWSIPLLSAGQKDSITFRAPRSTGVYPYVCTFPGHGSMMYGAMYVTNGIMPQLTADQHIPEFRRSAEETDTLLPALSGHPFDPEPPFLYRVLMPGAGPAAIAVCLSDKICYCWDAGACRLRYAWSGGFLDLTDYWTIKGEPHARVLGSIFYRSIEQFPLRLGHPDSIPQVDFKGYRLVEGFPEFHYRIDALEVYEIILPKDDDTGLIRRFRIPDLRQTLYFVGGDMEGVDYTTSKGSWSGNLCRFTAFEGQSFTLTLTRNDP
jgi:plastocyanin